MAEAEPLAPQAVEGFFTSLAAEHPGSGAALWSFIRLPRAVGKTEDETPAEARP